MVIACCAVVALSCPAADVSMGLRSARQALMPTRANILRGVDWLVKGVQAGDVLFFHFAGHGTQQPDTDGNEADGLDEALVPCDHAKVTLTRSLTSAHAVRRCQGDHTHRRHQFTTHHTLFVLCDHASVTTQTPPRTTEPLPPPRVLCSQAGLITDDQLFDRLVRPLPKGVRLTCVLDTALTEVGLDLPHETRSSSSSSWTTPAAGALSLAPADVRVFSSSAAGGTSASDGALTAAFIKALATTGRDSAPSHKALLDAISANLKPRTCALSSTLAFDLSSSFSLTDATRPDDPGVQPPPRGRVQRPAGQPKKRSADAPTRAAGGGSAAAAFKAPPKASWQDAPSTRKRGGGATPLASAKYGSNLAGADGIDWAALTAVLPTGRTDAAKAARAKLFSKFDFNGNGCAPRSNVYMPTRRDDPCRIARRFRHQFTAPLNRSPLTAQVLVPRRGRQSGARRAAG
jgi:hypothetical protein